MFLYEHIVTATVRMQEALHRLQAWRKKWLVQLNASKATYTIFSLANKNMKANLHTNGQPLSLDEPPSYLGVTFDR